MILRAAAASVILSLGLSACGSTAEQPTTSAPAGIAGAEPFASDWVRFLNQATQTGDTAKLRALAAPTCSRCGDFADKLDAIYGADGRIETDGWTVTKIVPEAGATDDQVTLLMTVQAAPETVYVSATAKPREYDGGEQAFRMKLKRTDGEWLVTDVEPR